MQEEKFLKQNADYENRLKDHVYKFEEGKSHDNSGAKGNHTMSDAN
jgi:hypothetical protein